MVFSRERFVSVAEVSTDVPVLTVGAVSKKCLVPGWRCGWIVAHDRNNILLDASILEALGRLQMITLGPCGLVQEALPVRWQLQLQDPIRPSRAFPCHLVIWALLRSRRGVLGAWEYSTAPAPPLFSLRVCEYAVRLASVVLIPAVPLL